MAITSGRIIQVNVAQLGASNDDHIAAAQFMPANLQCIDCYAIAAVQVFDNRTCGSTDNARMRAADESRLNANVVASAPPDCSDSMLERDFHIAFCSNL